MKDRFRSLLPAPSGPFIGPPLTITAQVMADRARRDAMPLRAPRGGFYTAERHPDVLRRQYSDLLQFTSNPAGAPLPVVVVYGLLVLVTLGMALAGWFIAPYALGTSTGVVQGASGAANSALPVVGALVGAVVAVVSIWWFFLRNRGGTAFTTSGNAMWESVYSLARITQVAYRNPAGQDVEKGAVDAERVAVRRCRAWLMRMAFADRQEGVFVSNDIADTDRPASSLGDSFLRGAIRIETTNDLSQITHPSQLYDGVPLSGKWLGVNSTRWFVALREPIEVGKESAEYEASSDPAEAMRRRLVGNAGFWMLAAGFVVGLMILLNGGDTERPAPDPVDRTPGKTAEAVIGEQE